MHESCVHMPGAGIGWTKIISKNHANGEQKSLVDIGCWSILRIASPICFRVSGSLSTLQNDFILIAFIDFKPLLIKRLHGELHEKHMLKTFKMNRNSMLNGSKTVQYEPGPKPRTHGERHHAAMTKNERPWLKPFAAYTQKQDPGNDLRRDAMT